MAQIQIWTRDVNGTSPFGDKAPQHTFFIKINDNGTREIIRGGPINDNMIMDDIIVVRQSYNSSKQVDLTDTYDYFDPAKPNTSNYQGTTVKTSSQSEIDSLWNKAWTKAQTINSQSYDGDNPLIGVGGDDEIFLTTNLKKAKITFTKSLQQKTRDMFYVNDNHPSKRHCLTILATNPLAPKQILVAADGNFRPYQLKEARS